MNVVHITYPISDEIRSIIPREGQTVAIGDFDGVHLGHREVIAHAVKTAVAMNCSSSVMTFHPHPREVLGLPKYSEYLTPIDRKLERFEELGLDTCYIVTFNHELASLSPLQFVSEILNPLYIRHVTIGYNFTFGHLGKGNPATLQNLASGDFSVDVISPFQMDGQVISSTRIREALAIGDIIEANKLLGRKYAVRGTVIAGEGRGRTIGIPTANLEPIGTYVTPMNGVYAVEVTIRTGIWQGSKFSGVMNIGKKPTFHAELLGRSWEVHLFDFADHLYGEQLIVRFKSFIRQEQKFNSVADLLKQIQQDIQTAKKC
jgi:riboflavin kinase/FMN adenylyltransferase